MSKTAFSPSALPPASSMKSFNFNKLQAVLCIGASATLSVSGIYWLIKGLV